MLDSQDINLICLTETKDQEDSFTWNKDIKIVHKRRNKDERAGGGLLIMHRKNKDIALDEIATKSKDILVLKGKICHQSWTIILVYMATGTGGETRQINEAIKNEIKKTNRIITINY